LNTLWCFANTRLSTLNGLSGLSTLRDLYCHETSISTLDVTGCSSLSLLWCFNNTRLSTLNGVTGLSTLTNLQCGTTSISTLDVSGCSSLQSAIANNCLLSYSTASSIAVSLAGFTVSNGLLDIANQTPSIASSISSVFTETPWTTLTGRNWTIQF
jgi:hypothetical protein